MMFSRETMVNYQVWRVSITPLFTTQISHSFFYPRIPFPFSVLISIFPLLDPHKLFLLFASCTCGILLLAKCLNNEIPLFYIFWDFLYNCTHVCLNSEIPLFYKLWENGWVSKLKKKSMFNPRKILCARKITFFSSTCTTIWNRWKKKCSKTIGSLAIRGIFSSNIYFPKEADTIFLPPFALCGFQVTDHRCTIFGMQPPTTNIIKICSYKCFTVHIYFITTKYCPNEHGKDSLLHGREAKPPPFTVTPAIRSTIITQCHLATIFSIPHRLYYPPPPPHQVASTVLSLCRLLPIAATHHWAFLLPDPPLNEETPPSSPLPTPTVTPKI